MMKLLKREEGVAAVEFALISPLLILLFFGVIEVSNLLITDSKLRVATSSVADIIAQDTGDISLTDLDNAAAAAQRIMFPLPRTYGTDMAILVNAYPQQGAPGGDWSWSRLLPNSRSPTLGLAVKASCFDDSLLPSNNMRALILARGVYIWRPWFATIFSANIRLESTHYFSPRYTAAGIRSAAEVTPPC